MVTVTLTGQQMPLSCDISEEAMAEGAKVVGEKVRAVLACCSPCVVVAGVFNPARGNFSSVLRVGGCTCVHATDLQRLFGEVRFNAFCTPSGSTFRGAWNDRHTRWSGGVELSAGLVAFFLCVGYSTTACGEYLYMKPIGCEAYALAPCFLFLHSVA